MNKEFNLSFYIEKKYYLAGLGEGDVIQAYRVKEFIRIEAIMIEELIDKKISIESFWAWRRKLAGENLT